MNDVWRKTGPGGNGVRPNLLALDFCPQTHGYPLSNILTHDRSDTLYMETYST